MAEKTLTLQSSNEELKAYFEAVCRIVDSNRDEFPINLDEVWPLVYGRKEEAVRALTTDFQYSEGSDYKVFTQKCGKPSRRSSRYGLQALCFVHGASYRPKSAPRVRGLPPIFPWCKTWRNPSANTADLFRGIASCRRPSRADRETRAAD